MAAPRLPDAVLDQLAAALEATRAARPDLPPVAVGNTDSVLSVAIRALAAQGGGTENTWRARWRAMRAAAPGKVPAFMTDPAPDLPPPPIPEAPPPKPRTVDDAVKLHRAIAGEKAARDDLRTAHTRIAFLEDRLHDLEWAAAASPTPADWTLTAQGGGASEHIPELLTSDFQIGEVIRSDETDCSHGYDVATFRRRYRQLIATTIDLSFNHAGGAWTYPGIVYARGGDTISGGIHDELAETDEVTPIEAVEIAFEEEAAGIGHLLDAFGRVEVKDAGGGNHDRDTHKPRSKRATGHSYDRLVSLMLRREFARDDRVTFQATRSPDVYFAIYDTRILLTHGDKIGSRGGMGMIGPAATIARGAQKVIMEQQALGRIVDQVQMGHFHTPLWLEAAICNGCLPGYSEFAKLNRMRPQPPSQFLLFHHPRWGLVDLKKIYLEAPL